MFVRVVWQESRKIEMPEFYRDSTGPAHRGNDFFPGPGADFRHMTLGLFDR